MARQRVDVFTLKEMLGHSIIIVTPIYVRLSPEDLSEVHRANSPLKKLPGVEKQMNKQAGSPRRDE